MAKVHLFDRLQNGGQPLVFPDNMDVVESAVTALRATLVVLDPISCYLKANLRGEQSVRKALMPFVTLAEKHNLSVLMVRHLRKSGAGNPIHLGMGSIAFVALARSSLLVGNDPTNDDIHRHVLTLNKSNLASATSLVYRTVQHDDGAIVIEWLGKTKVAAKDLAGGSASEAAALNEAMYVLYSLLCDGPLPAKEAEHRAANSAITKRTLHRAKVALKVRSIKRGRGKGSLWYWRLPQDESTYCAYKRHDLDCLMDQLCHGPSEDDIPDVSANRPAPWKRRRDDKDDGQLV